MLLTHLTIRHFRNIESLDWAPGPGVNLIWGANGQGKTNLLEAIHLALTGRSFRARADEDCLPWERRDDAAESADPTLAEVELLARPGNRRLRVIITREAKRAYADGDLVARLADLWALAAVITFTPEDAGLLKGPPAARRRFLDVVICQTSRTHLRHLQRYGQALRQLNAVLKMEPGNREARTLAEAFYPELAESGAAIMLARACWLEESAPRLRQRHAELGGIGTLDLQYDPDIKGAAPGEEETKQAMDALATACRERLAATHEEARRVGSCPVGAHRDDFALRLGGRDLRRFGSQGQHRLAALALKLEAARWIEARNGEPPILLLDDFGSELDPVRREAVLASMNGTMQVFVSATHPSDLGAARCWTHACRIEGGKYVGEEGPERSAADRA